MKFEYNSMRDAYYLGILLLALNTLKEVPALGSYLKPFFEWSVYNIPFMIVVAAVVVVAAFNGWRYRTIG